MGKSGKYKEYLQQTRVVFYFSPEKAFCRMDLVELVNQPINIICKVANDLLNSGYIYVDRRDISPYTGERVEFLKLNTKNRCKK